MAVGVRPAEAMARQGIRYPGPPSSRSERGAEGGEASRRRSRGKQTSQQPHLSPLICHTPAGACAGHTHHSGVAGPEGRENHHDLYPCAQPRPSRGAQPCRSCVAARTCGSRTRKPRVLLGLSYLKPYAGTGFSRRARAPWAWFAESPEGTGCGSWNLPIKSSMDATRGGKNGNPRKYSLYKIRRKRFI